MTEQTRHLRPSSSAAAQQPVRHEDQGEHDDDERRDVLELGMQEGRGERLDQADQHAAQHRAEMLLSPPSTAAAKALRKRLKPMSG